MKPDAHEKLEKYRVTEPGPYASSALDGNNGLFRIPGRDSSIVMTLMVSDGSDWELTGMPMPAWEHVSASLPDRCPTWEEMCSIKEIFWSDDEVVIQFHPAKGEYVNHHPYCLHLWKPIGVVLPVPSSRAVGPKE